MQFHRGAINRGLRTDRYILNEQQCSRSAQLLRALGNHVTWNTTLVPTV